MSGGEKMTNQPSLINEQPKQRNTTMLILQCIGIFAVVFGHADFGGTDIPNFFNVAFPYYSWHMPLFIFISGYFFNRQLPAGKYILKKLRNHLIPALVVNAACGVFSLCLKRFGLAEFGQEITLRALFVTPFTTGYQFYINISLWFIFTLFVIEVIACLMDRITRGKGDLVYLGITLAVSLYCCYRAFYDYEGTRGEFLNAGLRLGFLMFFFWLGVCYRKYFEKLLQPVLNIKTAALLFLLQAVILGLTQWDITYNTRDMDLRDIAVTNGFWVAIVGPITAMLFFLGVAYSLAPYLKKSKLLQEFGSNTKYVMYYHQFFFVFCAIMMGVALKRNLVGEIPGFSFERLIEDQYYTGGNLAITCVVALMSMILPIAVCRFIKKQRWYIGAAIYLGLFLLIILMLYLAGRVIH